MGTREFAEAVDRLIELGPNDRRRHELNPLARDEGGRLVYARRIIAAAHDHPE